MKIKFGIFTSNVSSDFIMEEIRSDKRWSKFEILVNTQMSPINRKKYNFLVWQYSPFCTNYFTSATVMLSSTVGIIIFNNHLYRVALEGNYRNALKTRILLFLPLASKMESRHKQMRLLWIIKNFIDKMFYIWKTWNLFGFLRFFLNSLNWII